MADLPRDAVVTRRRFAADFQKASDGASQLVILPRFRKHEVDRPQIGLDKVPRLRVAREDDQCAFRRMAPRRLEEIRSPHGRHEFVGDDGIDPPRLHAS